MALLPIIAIIKKQINQMFRATMGVRDQSMMGGTKNGIS